MVSTYLSYDLIQRDMSKSLERIASQGTVERDAAYYKENIGKVKTVDELLNNYRLYNYATTAFGLEDMSYAKAFMKKVLESDLTDSNSFANRLEDTKYRDFAAAFNFSAQTPVLQTEAQLDKIIGLYTANIENADDELQEETRYYNSVIGKATSVNQVLQNERTRDYVLTVFGIDKDNYNYATLKGAMTSDLNDPASYFNTELAPKLAAAETRLTEVNATLDDIAQRPAIRKLIDTTIPQTLTSADSLQTQIDTLKAGASTPENDALIAQKETQLQALFSSLGTGITDRAGVETLRSTKQAELAQINTRLPAEGAATTTLKTQLVTERDNRLVPTIRMIGNYKSIAAAYEFSADGTVATGGAQTEANRASTNELYIRTNPRSTKAKALLEKEYFESKIGSITDVKQITGDAGVRDDRLLNYIQVAFGLTDFKIVRATIENILTADLADPDSDITKEVLADPARLALHNAFNFLPDGTLAAGTTAQTASQTSWTAQGYMANHNDKDEKADEAAITKFKLEMQSIKFMGTRDLTAEGNFLNTKYSVYNFALQAVGIDPDSVSQLTIKNVLTSDLSDPKSYVYQTKDSRFLELARVLNFTKEGEIGTPVLAQSPFEMEAAAKEYIVAKSRFGTSDDKKLAEEEASYYTENMAKVSSFTEFLTNTRLMHVALVANGIDPDSLDQKFLKDIFSSDLDDPDSFVNTQGNPAFRSLVASFNFDTKGNVTHQDKNIIQTRRGLYEMHDLYLRQTMETQAGEDNSGVRLALYFERMAPTINSYYDVIADTALQEVFRVAFSLSSELSSMDVDLQVKLMQNSMDIEKLADPDELKKLIVRFTMLYDIENNVGVDPVMGLFSSSAGAGISADTLLAIAQIG